MRSRTTFATIEAAAIEAMLRITLDDRFRRAGKARRIVAVDEGDDPACRASAASARHMASSEACRMLMVSIS